MHLTDIQILNTWYEDAKIKLKKKKYTGIIKILFFINRTQKNM